MKSSVMTTLQNQPKCYRAINSAYTDFMLEFENLEDHRGVDISQIRRQLRMSVEERVRDMVHVANVMIEIQKTAQASMLHQVD